MPEASHSASEAVVQNLGRAQGVEMGFFPARRAKTEGSEDAACAAHLACRRWGGDSAHCVG